MTETQRRIRAYKKALPELRERVIAVALLLAMSASMLASASFAWITLSTAPEVSGMATTVAANGNLEIALAQGESMKNGVPVAAKEPNETAIGDSSVIQGIVNSNITWGNLVNLSDPEYGVSKIALRPALLNNTNRNKYPLYGAKYGSDGRVENTNQRYEFTSYQIIDEALGIKSFAAGDKAQYGVRAISSVGYDSSVGESILDEYRDEVTNAYGKVASEYKRMIDPKSDGHLVLTSGRTCIDALEGLVSVVAQDRINEMVVGGSIELAPSGQKDVKNDCKKYVYDVYEMLLQMKYILEWEGEGLRQLANWQAFSLNEANRNLFDSLLESETSTNHLLQYDEAELKDMGINLVSYKGFKDNYNTVLESIDTLVNNEKIAPVVIGDLMGIDAFSQANNPSLPKIEYLDIDESVKNLFDMYETTIDGTKITGLGGTKAMEILGKDDNPVVIKGGVLATFEKRALADSGQRLKQNAEVPVKTGIIGYYDKTVKGVVTTESYGYVHVKGDKTFVTDLENTDVGNYTGIGDAVAKDTYGMAIDLWVRTNYPNAVLTLEGNVLTTTIHAQDASGNYLYTLTIDGIAYEIYSGVQNSGPYYYVANGTSVLEEDLNKGSLSIVETEQIIGYEGENRIWSDEAMANMGQHAYLADDSTSQGSGSCFVFYAESKSEQQKLLEMLENFTIAFIDEEGGRLGTVKLNTQRRYESEGKITVPLEVITGVEYEQTLESGETETKVGIMNLVQNQPTRVTAIVYLDGAELKNENVLAAGELTGQLNIQFGTNTVLMPPPNEDLQQEYRTITLSAQSEDGQAWPNASKISYDDFDPDGHQITVNLNVDGVQPNTISGFFVRRISATQGSRLGSVDFIPVTAAAEAETSTWTATFHLRDPGTYIFSDLLVDGMQYPLEKDSVTKNHLTVEIPGLSLGTVTLGTTDTVIRTAESSYPIQVTAKVLADVATPRDVTVHFYEKGNEYNQVTARLTAIGDNNWQGDAVFRSSGTYILDAVSVDGTSLDISDKREITFYLGMRCEVYNARVDQQNNFDYEGTPVQVPVRVKVWDDGNNEIQDLQGVTLRYKMGNSETRGTQTNMTWNSAGYYEGVLTLPSPETYTFQYLQMSFGNSMGIINRADLAPMLKLRPKDPPAYVADSVKAHATQLAIDSSVPATMSAEITNAVTATIWAEMTKGTEKRYVSGAHTVDSDLFTFELKDLSDGTWTLTNLYAQGFTHADGTEYDVNDPNNLQEGESLGFRLTGVNQIQTRIVKNIKVTTALNDNDYIYDKDINGEDLAFMEEVYPVLTVKVTDQAGNAIDGVSLAGGTWNVTHGGKQLDYGGYTGSYGNGQYAVPISTAGVAQFADGSDGADELRTAGIYTSSVTLQLSADNGNASYTTSLPQFTVKTAVPTVTITGAKPSGSNATKINWQLSSGKPTFSAIEAKTSGFDQLNNTATLYAVPTVDNDRQAHAGFTKPEMTVSVAGVDSGCTVSFTLPGGGNVDDLSFSRTGNGTITKTLGKTAQIKTWTTKWMYIITLTHTLDAYYGHGSQTIEKVTVVKDGYTFTVTLPTPMVVNNPSSVNKTS